MKPIRRLFACPKGLDGYLTQGGDPTNWDRFRDSDPNAYRELRDALEHQQHGICGYCETGDIVQVEHIVPKNSQTGDPTRALDYTNLIGCCSGEKGKKSESCGQAKGERNDPDFIDPRALPAMPAVFRVELSDGQITVDETACRDAGLSAVQLDRTISILGLNTPRLKKGRLNCLDVLYENMQWCMDSGDFQSCVRQWACGELLPDDDGVLPEFFTTRRSYFSPDAEIVLAMQPQSWI